MYTSYLKYIQRAFRNHWAVGAFNVSDIEQAQAVVWAAEKLHAPVLVNTSEKALDYAGLKPLTAAIKQLAQAAKVPVTLNLDHGRTYNIAVRCAKVGFTSLMIDGSKLPYAKNVAVTRKVVQLGHKLGIPVEGELGALGGKEDYISGKVLMTDPQQAVDFVKKTKVDLLAVAIGNAHGIPQPHEHLDFPRLFAIHKILPKQPLVLHGASGTPSANIRHAIRLGIVKINIDTDLRLAFSHALRSLLQQNKTAWDPREILTPAREAVQKVVEQKIILFGSKGKHK
jgi:fructose-bisphosphate aldolase, class II